MKIIDIKAMKYLEDGSVSCEVMFEEGAGYIPYRAVENDSAVTGARGMDIPDEWRVRRNQPIYGNAGYVSHGQRG